MARADLRPRKLTVTGHFNDAEADQFLASVFALMKAVEQHHTECEYLCLMEDPEATLAEAERSVRQCYPNGQPPYFAKIEFGKKEKE